MLTKNDRNARFRAIEKIRLTRIKNLRDLCEIKYASNWALLGRACGQAGTFLISLAGPNPRRNIGEVLARDLERSLGLPSGWLDVER